MLARMVCTIQVVEVVGYGDDNDDELRVAGTIRLHVRSMTRSVV